MIDTKVTDIETDIKIDRSSVLMSEILLNFLMVVVILGLLSGSWLFVLWLNKPGNFPIKKVALVTQLENQKSQELQGATINALSGGFFSLNVDQLRVQLLEQLPWIKSVSVRKIWPDKLLVDIVEHKPIARWLSVEEGDNLSFAAQLLSSQLLSQDGIIFNPLLNAKQEKKFAQMILLTGSASNAEKILTQCVQFSKKLQAVDLALTQCGMNKRRSWQLKVFLKSVSTQELFNNDIEIKLGKENVVQHFERFVQVFSGQLKNYIMSIIMVDLRYSNGFAVKWTPVNSLLDLSDET